MLASLMNVQWRESLGCKVRLPGCESWLNQLLACDFRQVVKPFWAPVSTVSERLNKRMNIKCLVWLLLYFKIPAQKYWFEGIHVPYCLMQHYQQ